MPEVFSFLMFFEKKFSFLLDFLFRMWYSILTQQKTHNTHFELETV